jgi:hypothetical protein
MLPWFVGCIDVPLGCFGTVTPCMLSYLVVAPVTPVFEKSVEVMQ